MLYSSYRLMTDDWSESLHQSKRVEYATIYEACIQCHAHCWSAYCRNALPKCNFATRLLGGTGFEFRLNFRWVDDLASTVQSVAKNGRSLPTTVGRMAFILGCCQCDHLVGGEWYFRGRTTADVWLIICLGFSGIIDDNDNRLKDVQIFPNK